MSDDTISRQAAIDALDGEIEVTGKANANAVLKYTQMVSDRIKALPSAQSDLDEWCTDCKEYNQEKHCCPRWNRVIRETAEEIRKNAEQRWIPVSKPPEHPGRFLCYYDDECGHCIDFGSYDEDEGWYVSGVKYWMPLPDEPYERSEDGQR